MIDSRFKLKSNKHNTLLFILEHVANKSGGHQKKKTVERKNKSLIFRPFRQMNFLLFLPPVAIVLFAVISSIFEKFFRTITKQSNIPPTKPFIFVAIVSYCDQDWLHQVDHLNATALEPKRLRFGVVEYVQKAEESRVSDMPVEWRHFVKVHTVSKETATSQRKAWETCISELYDDEEFLLLTRRVEASLGWDVLMDALPPDSVFSSALTHAPTFPVAKRLLGPFQVEWKMEKFKGDSKLFIPSMICLESLIFCHSSALKLVLSSDDNVVASSALSAKGIMLKCIAQNVFSKGKAPRGVKTGMRKAAATAENVVRFLDSLGISRGRITSHAMAGLSPEASPEECVAKYGSVVAARIRMQELNVKTSARKEGPQRKE